MTEKIAAPKDPFDAVGEMFVRFASHDKCAKERAFWKDAASVDYRRIAFHSDMESKDVRVLVKALQGRQ